MAPDTTEEWRTPSTDALFDAVMRLESRDELPAVLPRPLHSARTRGVERPLDRGPVARRGPLLPEDRRSDRSVDDHRHPNQRVAPSRNGRIRHCAPTLEGCTDVNLRIAIPTKGRLAEPSAELLRRAGIRFERSDRALSVTARSAPVELLFVRSEDVAELVADGVAALGITGYDLLGESGFDLDSVMQLGFGRCTLTVAVPEDSPIEESSGLAEKRVATSHPRTVTDYFGSLGVEIETVAMRGSVEVADQT